MNLTVNRLKELFVKLGGAESVVAGCSTIVEVLNAISAKYDGKDDAILNPDAISNITEIADKIGGGGGGTPTNALIVEGVSRLRSEAFAQDENITRAYIPNTIDLAQAAAQGIGNVFYQCTNLASVEFAPNITVIPYEWFVGCTSLRECIAPDVEEIHADAFSACRSLENFDFRKVTLVEYEAFQGTGLVEAIMPNVRMINGRAFYQTPLKRVYIGPDCVSIESTENEESFAQIASDAVIDCGFAEGAIPGAPWGAPNTVTINYNVPPPNGG